MNEVLFNYITELNKLKKETYFWNQMYLGIIYSNNYNNYLHYFTLTQTKSQTRKKEILKTKPSLGNRDFQWHKYKL